MEEFIALAKNIDILVVFWIICGACGALLVYGEISFALWFLKKWDSFWKKHSSTSKDSKK